MTLFRNLMFVLLGTALFFTSCVKEDLSENTSTFTTESKPILETTLHGQVIDENDRPIQNAEVVFKSGDSEITVQTDEFGSFIFEDVMNRGRSAYVTVSSSGKFDAFRRFGVFADRYNYTVIKMNEKDIDGRIESAEGGVVRNVDGATVDLPANGIIDANGAPYNGTVNVAIAWINPDGDDLTQRMVGDLSGIDAEGRQRALMTYGMMQVELLDNSGNELNLSDEHNAELSFPIPQTMRGNAKNEIPLWIYDEELGTWAQEGFAELQGDFYVGSVPHFSSFNVDFMTDPIEITGQVKIETEIDNVLDTTNGSYLQVYVCSENIGRKGGYLCEDGSFRFYNFPKDEAFTLKILDKCGEVIYEKEYGPYSENTDLGCILVAPSSSMVSVSGNAVDCDANAIENGLFFLEVGNRKLQFPVEEDGTISFVVDLCDDTEGEFYVVDTDLLIQSDVVSIDLTSQSVSLGTIELCDVVQEYLEFEISNGETGFFSPDINFESPLRGIMGTSGIVTGDSLNANFNISFSDTDLPASPATNATVPVTGFEYYSFDNPNGGEFYYYLSQQGMTVVFDEYDSNLGGRMRGSFTGTIQSERDSIGMELDIMGTFDFTVK